MTVIIIGIHLKARKKILLHWITLKLDEFKYSLNLILLKPQTIKSILQFIQFRPVILASSSSSMYIFRIECSFECIAKTEMNWRIQLEFGWVRRIFSDMCIPSYTEQKKKRTHRLICIVDFYRREYHNNPMYQSDIKPLQKSVSRESGEEWRLRLNCILSFCWIRSVGIVWIFFLLVGQTD